MTSPQAVSTALPTDRYLALLEADGARLAEVARRGLDAPVPPCPGWTVGEAVRHTGSVYHHKIASMRLQRKPEDGEWPSAPGEGQDAVAWFEAALEELVRELVERGPDAPSFTWWPADQSVGFWFRRMAQETAVHRADVESAYEEMTPVDHDLATDGVDEVLTLMLAGDWSDVTPEEWEDVTPEAGADKTVAVRTGDSGWRVSLHPDRVEVTAEPGPSDATVTGEPSEVLLWLWGRRPDPAVRISGDAAVVAALRDRLRLATS